MAVAAGAAQVLPSACIGRLVRIRCVATSDGWHTRLLIARGTARSMAATTGESVVADERMVWWILTPDGDLYPEELSAPPLRSLMWVGADGNPDLRTLLEARRSRSFRPVHDFDAVPSPLHFIEMLAEVCREEARLSNGAPPGLLTNLGVPTPDAVVAQGPPSAADPRQAGRRRRSGGAAAAAA